QDSRFIVDLFSSFKTVAVQRVWACDNPSNHDWALKTLSGCGFSSITQSHAVLDRRELSGGAYFFSYFYPRNGLYIFYTS
ncbi:MAG: hypothetical protein ACKO2C_01510, partial [Actinomycetes bacterium]